MSSEIMEMLKNGEILFLYPAQQFLYLELKKAGFYVEDPLIGRNNPLLRIARELSFRTGDAFGELWYRKIDLKKVQLIFAHEWYMNAPYVKWLKNRTKARIVVVFHNKIKTGEKPAALKALGCELWSSDEEDCAKYDLQFYPFGVYLHTFSVRKTTPFYDTLYIGQAKPGRYQKLKELQTLFQSVGLRFKFHLATPLPFGIRTLRYGRKIPYSEILDELGKTRSILHLSEGAQSGITFRIVESLVHGIKLITDDQDIHNRTFYHPDNIFILGRDQESRLPEFLKSDFVPAGPAYLDSFFIDRFLQEIILQQNEPAGF
ncbi:MAG: hypothetical protein ACOX55_09020 [Christensenellales bacterium]|jgi:hypothetical protein